MVRRSNNLNSLYFILKFAKKKKYSFGHFYLAALSSRLGDSLFIVKLLHLEVNQNNGLIYFTYASISK